LETCDAYRRGLRYGDEILAFGGREINTVNGFKSVLGIFPKDWRVPLSFMHEDERRDVYVRLMGVHTTEELISGAERKPKITPPDQTPKPKPKKEDREPDDQPDEPSPIPPPEFHRPKPLPNHDKPLIVKRSGYANYYFNELNRDRVSNGFRAHGDFSVLAGPWKLVGADEGGGKVEIELGDAKITGRFPGEFAQIEPAKDLAEQLAPRGSGGLLAALHLWRRFLISGPKQFGDVYYSGTAPVIERPGLFDVLVATHDVIESRLLFDPDSGLLIGIEMFPDTTVDPCEIYFADYREIEGRKIPHTLLVRHGDHTYMVIKLAGVELSPVATGGT
jgi:hypothetical protein